MAETAPQASEAATTTEAAPGLLDQIIGNTKQTEPDRAQDLVKNLVEQALAGTVTFDRNLTRTFDKAIAAIDRKLSAQLNAIMHDPKFLKLEGTLARPALPRAELRDRHGAEAARAEHQQARAAIAISRRAIEFDQSQLFKKIYENEFGTPGGEPYGALIGDYEWTNHPDDIETLRLHVEHRRAAFAPFISAAGASMFGFDDWTELSQAARPRQDLRHDRVHQVAQLPRQRGLALRQPGHAAGLARVPYGKETKPIDEFDYEEAPIDAKGKSQAMDHELYCWSNAAYVMGARLTDAFAQTGFCTAIRGAEGGGKVENLPTHVFMSDDGDADAKCPTEIGITDRREFELSQPRLPAAVPLQEHRLRRVLRRPDRAEAEEVRPARGDRERRHLGAAALHHGDQPFRPLSEGDGARQDRQLHGSQQLSSSGSTAGSRTTSTPTRTRART